MALFRTLRNAFQAWRDRRRVHPRTRQRTQVALEQLDHRRLLAVNFTGNAIADIPDTTEPGTVIIHNEARVPIRNPQLNDLIKVSGFDIEAIRMKYTPDDDVLSVAIQQPLNQKTDPPYPVIAGDADNNGNGGTVNPAVRMVQPLFMDFPNLGGSETMAIFLDFDNDGIPDVVAGVPNTPGAGKFYTVNEAIPNPSNPTGSAPSFGTPLPGHTGYAFLRDTDPAHGAFEFQITHYSELFLEQTGEPLEVDSTIQVGAFAGSFDDFIDEAFVPAQPASFGLVPPEPPTPPEVECPPLSPPILINPHEHRHINTAHAGFVRVHIFGTSGFDVNRISTETVRFGGAEPVAHFTRHLNRDEFLDVTYVFRSDEVVLPPGQSMAHVTGEYVTDTGEVVDFDSAKIVFNRTSGFFGPGELNAQQRRQMAFGGAPTFPTADIANRAREGGVDLVIDQLQRESVQPWSPVGRPLVSIPTGGAVMSARLAGHPVQVGGPRMMGPQASVAQVAPQQAPPAHSEPVTVTIPESSLEPTDAQARTLQILEEAGYLDELANSLAV